MAKHSQAAQRCTSAIQFGPVATRCILPEGHPEDHHGYGLMEYPAHHYRWSRDVHAGTSERADMHAWLMQVEAL